MDLPFQWSPKYPKEPFLEEIKKRANHEYSSAMEKQPSYYAKDLADLMMETEKTKQGFRQQLVDFRKGLLYFLLLWMSVETVALFAIIVLASLPSKVLVIGDVTLQILVGATIAQISAMLIVIIRSVYSDSLNTLIMSEKYKPQE